MILLAGAAAIVFALVHLLVDRMRFLDGVPRSRWLSLAGGVAVAYVFMHLLPDLSEHHETLARRTRGLWDSVSNRSTYLIAMAGLAVFYGLERWMRLSRARQRGRTGEDQVERHVFWLHIASFGLYNLLIGYLLLHREQPGTLSLAFYTVALALHFVTTDYGLLSDQKRLYMRAGRWILAVCVLAGFGLGLAFDVSEWVIAVLFAFLAGGILLNVLKEELPEERQSRYWPFAGGAAGYAALLLLLA